MGLLDHVLICNLERREDKYWFAIGALATLGFDCFDPNNQEDGQVIRFLVHDGLDYPDVVSVQEAAIADGFEELAEYGFYNRAQVAWFWSWRCALRRIVEMEDKTVMLLIDDYVPKDGWTFTRFVDLVYSCEREAPEHGLRMMQLHHTAYADERLPEDNDKPYTTMLAQGLSGVANYGTILNAEGAQMLLNFASKPPYCSPELDFGKIAKYQDDPDIFHGLWHTLDDVVHLGCMWESDIVTGEE